MPDEDAPETIAEAIEENASGPKSMMVDGQRVEQHAIKDQIEADRYLSSKRAARRGLGLRFVKLVPPGTA